MIDDREAPGRIRNRDSYRRGQPDLDVYNPCFTGFASPAFCGTDLDGLFYVDSVVHGVWERRGHFLVQEHKASPTAWNGLGQWIALNELGELGLGWHEHALRVIERTLRLTPEQRAEICANLRAEFHGRLVVVVTYGEEPDRPTSYHRLPLAGWKNGPRVAAGKTPPTPMDLSAPDSTPHRKWIRWVHERSA